MKFIYFDNPVIRSLSDRPETWNELYDQFIRTFGRRFKPIESFYLFFEYIGFTKKHLDIPINFKMPHLGDHEILAKIGPHVQTVKLEHIDILDKKLSELLTEITLYTEVKLRSLNETFEKLIEKRKERISTFQSSQEVIESLFGNIFLIVDTDFPQFVKYAARYLSWDIFCSIRPYKLPLNPIRQRQLGIWLEFFEKGILLPFGKIIDDQSDYYEMDFTSHFKDFEDMVDSELHTYMTLGYKDEEGTHPVSGIVYPPKDPQALSGRNELALGTINNIQKTLGRELDKFPGKLYSLDEKTHSIKEINEPMIVISLPFLNQKMFQSFEE